LTLGLYGLSGSVTNVLAIVMIFDKIPFVIGSGLIEKNFEQFKKNLKDTLIFHLFSTTPSALQSLDYDHIANDIYPRLLTTSFGVMFQWITPQQVALLFKEIQLETVLSQSLSMEYWDEYLTIQINKLTPAQIKDLIFKILDEHLQWLVFWGAFLGMLIGVIDLLLR
jgi:uncharacterized membrane protein YheB (UPF0754 family)